MGWSGIFTSNWNNFTNFKRVFNARDFWPMIRNTVGINLWGQLVAFPSAIIFALLLNEIRNERYKKTLQTISYLPHFVSWVTLSGLFITILSPSTGPVAAMYRLFGATPYYFMGEVSTFRWVLVITNVWKSIGWGSIMYVAAISQVSGDLHEAAALDGATRLQRMFKITLPSILPMILMMFVINVGTALAAGYDNILLLYMPSTYSVSDTVYTYTYRQAFGAGNSNYSLSAASGLFQSVVSTILLVGSNALSRKAAGSSLF